MQRYRAILDLPVEREYDANLVPFSPEAAARAATMSPRPPVLAKGENSELTITME